MKVVVNPINGDVSLVPGQKVVKGGGTGPGRKSYVNLVASDPASAAEGDMIYNTTDGALKVYYNGAWVTIGSGTSDTATFDFMDDTDFLFMDDTGFDFMDA